MLKAVIYMQGVLCYASLLSRAGVVPVPYRFDRAPDKLCSHDNRSPCSVLLRTLEDQFYVCGRLTV